MKRYPQIRTTKLAIQRGFTLIELAIVVGVIGVLIAILAPNLIGSADGAKAQNYYSTAAKISNNLMMLSQTAGVSTNVSGNPLIASGSTIEDVIFNGTAAVAAAYQGAYGRSKILPLSEIASPVSGGGWAIDGARVSITGGGTTPLAITYTCLSDTIALTMVQKYLPSATALTPAGATVSQQLSYGAVTSGCVPVTVYKTVN